MRVPIDIAARIAEVKISTIRQWVKRGVIAKYDDGYEITELLLWMDQNRNEDYNSLRLGLPITRQQKTG